MIISWIMKSVCWNSAGNICKDTPSPHNKASDWTDYAAQTREALWAVSGEWKPDLLFFWLYKNQAQIKVKRTHWPVPLCWDDDIILSLINPSPSRLSVTCESALWCAFNCTGFVGDLGACDLHGLRSDLVIYLLISFLCLSLRLDRVISFQKAKRKLYFSPQMSWTVSIQLSESMGTILTELHSKTAVIS